MENHIAAKSDDTNVLCWCGSEKWRGTWSNLTDQGTICPLQPNERYKSGATHPFRANMNILTGSERAVTALQGQELFNDFQTSFAFPLSLTLLVDNERAPDVLGCLCKIALCCCVAGAFAKRYRRTCVTTDLHVWRKELEMRRQSRLVDNVLKLNEVEGMGSCSVTNPPPSVPPVLS